MSEQVQAILETVRGWDAEQRRELVDALALLDPSPVDSSAERRKLIESIRGKYRDVPTSADAFIKRKQEDLDGESLR